MRIATFNCNSVRVRLPIILDWLAQYEPDVLALQETKVEDSQFPAGAFEDLGWHSAFHGRKSYNGVAFLSRKPMRNVNSGFTDLGLGEDHRVICAEIGGVSLINTYVPNGSSVGSDKFDYKLKWLQEFRAFLGANYDASSNVVWVGDINIAPTPDDVFESAKHYGKVGHHPDEMRLLKEAADWGFTDVFRKFHEGPGHYTFWEFYLPKQFERNLGWRIDHIYATKSMSTQCTSCEIDRAPRAAERPSDHTFVYADFDLP